MSLYRRNPRRDENEPAIRKAVEALGATWQSLSIPGGPDALIGFRGESALMEVKQPKGKLRASQEAWHARWRGSPVIVARTPAEAVAALLGQRVSLSRVLASEQAAAPAMVSNVETDDRCERCWGDGFTTCQCIVETDKEQAA